MDQLDLKDCEVNQGPQELPGNLDHPEKSVGKDKRVKMVQRVYQGLLVQQAHKVYLVHQVLKVTWVISDKKVKHYNLVIIIKISSEIYIINVMY